MEVLVLLATVFFFLQTGVTQEVNCAHDQPTNGFAHCQYKSFQVILRCSHRAPILSWTTLGADTGSENTRSRNYKIDHSSAITDCQQTSANTYKNGYDVGHLTAIDHLDHNTSEAIQTNFMTNLLPQVSSFDRNGAWRKSERMVECYRDEENLSPLEVYAGPVFGSDPSNDIFSATHGLPITPDAYWKVVYSPSFNGYDAWIMPNSAESKASKLSQFSRELSALVTVLERDDTELHQPSIEMLELILNEKPTKMELMNNSKCNHRRG